MFLMKTLPLLAATLLLLLPASAVTLHGTVLDSGLESVEAIVEITSPRQVAAAANGSYSFEVSANKNYSLTARTTSEPALQETIQLEVGDGDVRFDIVLLSPAGLEQGVVEVVNETADLSQNASLPESIPLVWMLAIAAAIAAMLVIAFLFSRQKTPPSEEWKEQKQIQMQTEMPEAQGEKPKTEAQLEMNEFKQKILSLLSEKGGAAEQKELRRELPWSEARVSIELTELEKMGLIKKLKKGRANLVKLI